MTEVTTGPVTVDGSIFNSWCPTCLEHVVTHDDGRCMWCSTQTGGGELPPEPKPRRRTVLRKGDPGWGPTCECGRPKSLQSKRCQACWEAAGKPRCGGDGPRPCMRIPQCIRVDDLEEARRLYASGMSLRAVAREIHPRTEYKTVASCAEGLYSLFKTRGWKLRPQRQVTAARNHRHGRKRRNVSSEEERAYRRWLRDERGWNSIQGPGRPQCKGVKSQPPRKGTRCVRHAMEGSEYCNVHDPARQLECQAICARMRARRPAHDAVPFEPFAAWVEDQYTKLGTLSAVANLLGCSASTVSHIIRRQQTTNDGGRRARTEIGRASLERYLERPGTPTYDELYPLAEAA